MATSTAASPPDADADAGSSSSSLDDSTRPDSPPASPHDDHAQSHLDAHSHDHFHARSHINHARSLHARSHVRRHSHHDVHLHRRQDDPSPDPDTVDADADAAAPPDADGEDSGDSPLVTSVVQAVELVQVVDHAGVPISTRTVYPPPATIIVDRESGETVTISAPGSSSTVPASRPGEPSSNGSASPSTSRTYNPSVTYPATTHNAAAAAATSTAPGSAPPPAATDSSASSGATSSSPSAPPSAPPPPHVPTGTARNGTDSTSGNATVKADSFSTDTLLKHSSTSLSDFLSSHTSTSDDDSTTTRPTSTSDLTWSSIPWSTTTGTGSWGDVTVQGGEPTSTLDSAGPDSEGDSANDDSGSGSGGGGGGSPIDLSPREKQIVGGVVGSIAGVAVLLILVLMALKYKKRRDQVREIIGDGPEGAARAITAGPESGGGGNGAGASPMAERPRTAIPFAVPAALAGLAAKKKNQTPPASPPAAATGETGFVRVSGRKLPSVLQHGGDGYTDPRESYMSGESDYYRGSQAFEPAGANSDGTLRLALGSPMRPVSGVPVMRSGPGRTAVTTETNPNPNNPFDDPPSPPPPRGSLGRSPASNDGSRGSGSRFQEEI